MKVQASISIKNNNVGALLARRLLNATVSQVKIQGMSEDDVLELNEDILDICYDNKLPEVKITDVTNIMKSKENLVVGFIYKNKEYWSNDFTPKYTDELTDEEVEKLSNGKDLDDTVEDINKTVTNKNKPLTTNKKITTGVNRRKAKQENIKRKFNKSYDNFSKLVEQRKKQLEGKYIKNKNKKTPRITKSAKKAKFTSTITNVNTSDILVSSIITHLTNYGTRTVRSETTAKVPPKVYSGLPRSITKVVNNEKKKLMFRRWYGCYIAAARFQILVSNTPMDEEYSYRKKIVKVGMVTNKQKEEFLKGNEKKVVKDVVKESEVNIKHTPDNDYVRGDWILYFRGKTFKAFETSNNFSADHTFEKNMFDIKVSEKDINAIANILYEKTKDYDFDESELMSIPATKNINKRCEMLDKGGFYKNPTEEKTGPRAKYTHGVSSTLLTYQAPRGFIEISEAYWKEYVQSALFKGTLKSFLKNNKNALDVSRVSKKDKDSIVQNILKKYPEIQNFKVLKEEIDK